MVPSVRLSVTFEPINPEPKVVKGDGTLKLNTLMEVLLTAHDTGITIFGQKITKVKVIRAQWTLNEC